MDTTKLGHDYAVVLYIQDRSDPIILEPAHRIILGRSDVDGLRKPHVDLTQDGGLKRGVSRFHAAIECRKDSLTLVDLGSTNGTYLNGSRLIDHEPRELSDGDEIRLGTMVIYCFFDIES